jgi:hypothetical protein
MRTALLVALLAAPAAAQSAAPLEPRDATAEIGPPPNWSIKEEVKKLDTSMKEYGSLINSLSSASTELGREFEAYLKDPHNEVLASSVEKKMAQYASRVMADMNGIIADQDVLGSNFNDLQRKLVVFSRHLGGQASEFKLRLDGYRGTARDVEKRLTEMSVQIKERPPEDPAQLRALKAEFAREFRRYRLQTRYVNGYNRRYRNYLQLQKNMETLAQLFVSLHEKFGELIDNLENERQYLQDSLRLQADTVRIKQVLRDGIFGSEQAIGNVADKLANLYLKVDAFSTVHERINADLNKFVESQEALLDVTKRIDAIGATGGPIGDIGADMDKAIETFYGRRNGDPEQELLGAEKEPEELLPDELPTPPAGGGK